MCFNQFRCRLLLCSWFYKFTCKIWFFYSLIEIMNFFFPDFLNVIRIFNFLCSVDIRISCLEIFHERCEMSDAFNWHCIVHWNPDSWAESMSFNLNDSIFASFLDKFLLKIEITSLNSENNVDSTSPSFLRNISLVVAIGVIKEVPEHGASNVG